MNICILGGGTAGWMTAAYLKSTTAHNITLIESKEIKIVGVGESTVPSFADFIKIVGITEQELFDKVGAIRKYSSQHNNWFKKNHKWFHHFIYNFSDEDEQLYWMNNNILPDKKWRFSYHIDAYKFSNLLREKFQDIINHNYDTVEEIKYNHHGITELVGKEKTYTADIFIDCSGFKQMLLKLFTNKKENNNNIINNKAWAGHADYTDKDGPVPYTRTYAMKYGWQWNICLSDRAGVGYVFCDDFVDPVTAKKELISNCPFNIREDSLHLIDFSSQWNSEPWSANVIAVGLSAGFLEPLESQSIFLLQMQIQMIERLLENPKNSKLFNKFWNIMIRHIAKYLEIHYTLSKRKDTNYWKSFNKINIVEYNSTYSPLFHEYGHQAIAIAYRAKFSNESN